MKVRITERMWNELCEELLKNAELETAGILLGESVDTHTGPIVTIRHTDVVPDDAYLIRKGDQLSIDPVALNRITKPARDNGWSIFTIHTHPMAIDAWFSRADDIGDSRLMPSFHYQVPGVPHGSVVITSSGNVAARVFDENAKSQDACIQIVGKVVTHKGIVSKESEPWFARQKLALGEEGQAKLRSLRVGIIGLGGIGSLISMQLAHLGVGELVLVDGDIVEVSNLSRIVGSCQNDVGQSYKVDVAARYIDHLGLLSNVECYPEYLRKKHESLIASCDVVLSCVDTHSARAILNRLSYKCYVPVIDLGTVFRVDEMGEMISDAGRVVTIGPGRPCLGCWGHIDSNAIRIEALSPEDLEKEINDGYIQGANVAQPSVMGFNTYISGAGVTEFLRLATGFSGTDNPPNRLAFSFNEGTVKRNGLVRNPTCSICGDNRDKPRFSPYNRRKIIQS